MEQSNMRIPVTRDSKHSYDIVISHDMDSLAEEIRSSGLSSCSKVCIVSDSIVAPLYLDAVLGILKSEFTTVVSYIFEAGEQNKNLGSIEGLYEFLINEHFDRKSLLVALGGGVVGDMTGFAAATYLRGISFIQIPTTLLSQVDSSVGGKTGVDYLSYKNMVGAFYMPKLVYINTGVLDTLDTIQFSSGMAEVIKYGLIMDREFYSWLSDNVEAVLKKDPDALAHMIFTSCDCKRRIVEEDPTEKGIRAILNFGHTIGHAIEKLSDFSLAHGHCVGIGMYAAAYLSCKRGCITESDVAQLTKLLKTYLLPVSTSGMSVDDVIFATKSDKKMSSGQIRFILLEAIGKAMIADDISDGELAGAIDQVIDQ